MKVFINFIYLTGIGITLSCIYLVSLPDTKYVIMGIIFSSFFLLSTGLMLENKMDKYIYVFISIMCFIVISICIYKESEANSLYNNKHTHKYIIDLPKEIEKVDSQDKMTIYFNDTRDTLFIRYRYHICFDTTHLSCDGTCKCDGLGCYNNTIEKE